MTGAALRFYSVWFPVRLVSSVDSVCKVVIGDKVTAGETLVVFLNG